MTLRDVSARWLGSALAGAAILALVLGFATAAGATPLSLDTSEPMLMIDGNSDSNATVTVAVIDVSYGYEFGFVDDGFNLILADSMPIGTHVFEGGDIVDFAIRDATTDTIYSLSDGLATMYFVGDVDAADSEHPIVPFDYWKGALITWSIGAFDIVFNIGGSTDGLAPASLGAGGSGIGINAPEPGAALLFGVGFIVVGWAVRRDMSA